MLSEQRASARTDERRRRQRRHFQRCPTFFSLTEKNRNRGIGVLLRLWLPLNKRQLGTELKENRASAGFIFYDSFKFDLGGGSSRTKRTSLFVGLLLFFLSVKSDRLRKKKLCCVRCGFFFSHNFAKISELFLQKKERSSEMIMLS